MSFTGGHGGGSGGHGGGGHGGGGSWHGGGFHGHGFHGVGFPFYGWGWWGWNWGWGWAPYWSSWWWGGPGVYVAAGDGYGYGDGYGDDGYGYGNVGVAPRMGRFAVVKTDVSPEEAQIFLDGKFIGSSDDFDGFPDYLYLGTGKYHIELRLPGYETQETDLDVTAGQHLSLEQKLKLESGKSALDQFPPPSKGTPLGRVFTKQGNEAAPAPRPAPYPAPHHVQQQYERPATEGPGEPAMGDSAEGVDLHVDSLPRPSGNRARMRFKVTPEDAAVYVDDKYLGMGEDLAASPRGVVTDPGTHSVTVTRPGYKPKTVAVTVHVGAPVDVVVELEK